MATPASTAPASFAAVPASTAPASAALVAGRLEIPHPSRCSIAESHAFLHPGAPASASASASATDAERLNSRPPA